MPFKACAPRALPPDVALPLWESIGPFPCAACPPPTPAPEGRPRPRGLESIRSPGSSRPSRGGWGAGVLSCYCPLRAPQVCRNHGGRGRRSPCPSLVSDAHTQGLVFVPRVLRWARAAVAAVGCPHSGNSQGTRLPRTELGGLGFFSASLLSPPSPQPHTHTGKLEYKQPIIPFWFFSSFPLCRLYVCLLATPPPHVPRAPHLRSEGHLDMPLTTATATITTTIWRAALQAGQ